MNSLIFPISDELEVRIHVIALLQPGRHATFSDTHIFVVADRLFWTVFMKQQLIACSKLQELEPVQKYNVCVRECCK
jgi:hypothetical protein